MSDSGPKGVNLLKVPYSKILKKMPPISNIPPIIPIFFGISSKIKKLSTFVKCDCTVEHSAHSCYITSEHIVERCCNTDDYTTSSCIVKRIVLNIDHQEKLILKYKLTIYDKLLILILLYREKSFLHSNVELF